MNRLLRRCLTGLAGTFLISACTPPPAPEPPPRPVRLSTVQYDKGVTSVRYSGDIRARYENPLAFQVGGKLLKRLVDVGAIVKRGQVLAILDPTDIRLDEANATAQLDAAQAALALARRELRHLSHLRDIDLASPAAVERRQDQVNSAEAQVAAARALQGQSTRKSGYTELRSDFDGVVTAVEAEPGQIVTAGLAILRLARADEKEVVISVPENRLQDLRAASAIRVNLWADPERFYPGRLREISPGVDEVLRTYTAKIAIPNADARVALGMTATVHVETALAQAVARLPLTALTREHEQPAVWVFDPASSTVQARPVTLAHYDAENATVLSGVTDGEQVVTAGVHKLIAGQRVRRLGVAP